MGTDNTENITPIKPIENRRPDGTFGPGNIANPFGRPKKGTALTDIMRQALEEETPSGKTRKELLVNKVMTEAFNGNESMMKLVWNYMEGMPTQRVEMDAQVRKARELIDEITDETIKPSETTEEDRLLPPPTAS